MMNIMVMGLALIVAAIMENLLPACVVLGQAKLPIMMSIIMYYALNRSSTLMLISAVLGGMLCDSMNALPLGYSSLCFVGGGALVRTYRDVVFSGKWVTHMVFGGVMGIGVTLALYLLLLFTDTGIQEASWLWITMKVIGVGGFGVILVPIVFRVMERLDRMVGNTIVEVSE